MSKVFEDATKLYFMLFLVYVHVSRSL